MKDFFDSFTTSFPDMKMEIIKSMICGDEIAYYYNIKGTQERDFLGFPAHGQKVDFDGMTILKIDSGLCTEA